MDKYEYKIKADEIKSLIAQGQYPQAAEIADTIDWRRVKSVMMLCTISDLYKINRRFEDARDLLLMAYDRNPGGRTIVYSLCDLSIKIEDYVMAVEYYKEFVQIAPRDTGRYILQYKLYEAQNVSLEERIAVLEELKSKEYRERWAYELAYLYHRVGLATKCVEECDELILWFGEGKYVIKAMELKMLHQPLSPSQQEKYDARFAPVEEEPQEEAEQEQSQEGENEEEMPQEQEGEAEVLETEPAQEEPEVLRTDSYRDENDMDEILSAPTTRMPVEAIGDLVKTMEFGQYNTINLQKELAEGLAEVLAASENNEEAYIQDQTKVMMPVGVDTEEVIKRETEAWEAEEIEANFVEGTGEILQEEVPQEIEEPQEEQPQSAEVLEEEPLTEETEEGEEEEPQTAEEAFQQLVNEVYTEMGVDDSVAPENVIVESEVPDTYDEELYQHKQIESLDWQAQEQYAVQPPKEMSDVLSMQPDGQISMVVPEEETVEKQITGQISINDILLEWERMKKQNEEKHKEQIRQRVLQQTGRMFTDFEASIRDGLLEELEKEPVDIYAEETSEAEDTAWNETEDDIYEGDDAQTSFEEVETEPEEYATETEEVVTADFSVTQELAELEGDELEAQLEESEEYPEEETEEYPEEETEEYPEEETEEYPEEETEEYPEEETEEYPEEETEEYPEEETEEYPEEETEEYPEEETQESEEETEELAEIEEENAQLPEEDSEEASEEETEEEETEELAEIEEENAELPEEENAEEVSKEISEAEEAEEENTAEDTEKDQKASEEEEGGESDEEASKEEPVGERKHRSRSLTKEEKDLFAPFIQSTQSKEQLVQVLDTISLASYTGNVIITGAEGMDTMSLAKNMIKDLQQTDSNFSGKVAKITGENINRKNIEETLEKLANGALIVQKASGMNTETADNLYKALQMEKYGIVVIMEDTKKAMRNFLAENPKLEECFNAKMSIEALSNEELVAFGKKYAYKMEYSIDNMGILALHTVIEQRQNYDHAVTILEVKEIVDDAIAHVNKKNFKHLADILTGKRYDEEDMIILRENDFMY